MNKKNKKVFQKEIDKDKNTKLPKDPKPKLKNPEKNIQLPPKPKTNSLKITKPHDEPKKYNRNIKIHNSISSKEEVKKKMSPAKIRNKPKKDNLTTNNTYSNTNNSNTNRLLSNYLYLTNEDFQIKDENKKAKKNKNIKNYSNGEKLNLPELHGIFKKNMLKKTIIIDNEGNNNLNLDIKKGEHDYKKLLYKDNDNNNTFLSNSFNANTETNSLFDNSNKSYFENINYNYNYNYNNNIERKTKEDDIKQTIIDKNEEERRLKEYNKIFNLLNSNIEQFKKMFNTNKNNNNNINNNNNNNNNNNKNKKIIIKNKKNINNKNKSIGSSRHSKNQIKINDNYNNKKLQTNLKKNLSEKNLSSMNKYSRISPNLFTFDIKNEKSDNYYNNEINNDCSFLESSIQDDFYQSLINQTFLQNISHISLEINTDDISNNNIEQNKNTNNKISKTENNKYKKDDLLSLADDEKEKYKNNIHKNKHKNWGSPLSTRESKKVKENLIGKDNDVENENNFKTYLNIDKNNCFII